MAKYEELMEKAIEELKYNDDLFVDCVNELDSWNGYADGFRGYPMYELNDLFYGVSVGDFLDKLASGFNHNDEYFIDTVYGLDSCDNLAEYYRDNVDEGELVDRLIEEYDNETVLDVYIKQDPKNICKGDIADYIRNEFEYSEDFIKEELNNNIIGLAYTTSWLEEYEDTPLQASYDMEKQELIFEGGSERATKPVKYEDIDGYLGFDYLVGECNDLLDYEDE